MRRPPIDEVPGLGALVGVPESRESPEVTESPESRDSPEAPDVRGVLDAVRSSTVTERATYHLSDETRGLIEWLRRHLPGEGEVPTRSEAVGVAVRLAAEAVSRATGIALPGDG